MDFDKQKLLPVLIGIHLVALPMYTRLPPYVLLLVAAFTLWTLLIIARRVKQPNKFIRILLTMVVLFSLIVSYGTIFGQAPGTSMLLMLSFLKLFEMKHKRDVLMVVFLGYFLIATNFFHTQSPWIAAYVFVVVIYLTSLLIAFSDRLSTTDIKHRVRLSLRMVVQAIPLMLILFVLFPRLSGPLWSLPKDAQSAKTGVGDEMSPGSINNLISSGSVAFRVQFTGEVPAQKDLYWRGVVLSKYDGKTWRRDKSASGSRPELIVSKEASQPIKYNVVLEPHGREWLYSLETVAALEDSYSLSRELEVIVKEKVNAAMMYEMVSNVNTINLSLSEQEKDRNLTLPEYSNPYTVNLARELKFEADNNADYINAVLSYFREQGFIYTLSPPLLGNNAMDDFIFSTRRGFCEHYSSAFVYLMRAAGIPARVVVGYQGGTLNPLDSYMIVRQSDAHAWSEVWLDKRGWVRVDPTAAVSPDRIEQGIARAGLEEARLPSILISDSQLLQRIRFTLDRYNYNWNKWVIGFNDKRQKELFKKLGVEDIKKSTLFLWLVIAMSLSGVLVAIWVFSRGMTRSRKDQAVYYYGIFCQKLAKHGLDKRLNETAEEFLSRVVEVFPEIGKPAASITRHYQAVRYGGQQQLAKQLVSEVKAFKLPRS